MQVLRAHLLDSRRPRRSARRQASASAEVVFRWAGQAPSWPRLRCAPPGGTDGIAPSAIDGVETGVDRATTAAVGPFGHAAADARDDPSAGSADHPIRRDDHARDVTAIPTAEQLHSHRDRRQKP
jgi:hypothetical protein